MLVSLRPKSFPGLPDLRISGLKWLSTAAATQNPEDNLRSFFTGRMYPTQIDYKLALVSALKSRSSLAASFQGQQIHCLVLKAGLDSNNFIRNSLINTHAKCGFIADAELLFDSCYKLDSGSARQVFEKMPKKGCVSYTTMIMGLAQDERWTEAVEVFRDMRSAGVIPNEVTMATVISTYSHLGGVWNCRMLHTLVIRLQLEGFVLVSTNLLHIYWGYSCKGCGFMGYNGYVQVEWLSEALMMYRAMLRTRLGANDVMLVDLISACGRSKAVHEGQQLHGTIVKEGFDCYDFIQATTTNFYAGCGDMSPAHHQFQKGIKEHSDQPELALELLQRMVASGIRPNEITMVSVLSGIASLGTLKEARWAHEYIVENSIPLNDNLSVALIDMYAKCGSINTAFEVFYQIRDKTSTVSPWNAIICGSAMYGHAKLSLEIFSDLQYMKNVYNVEPNIKHYGCMVDLLGRAGRVEGAEKMIRSMPLKADVVIWGMLLAACGTHGNLERGEMAAESLTRLQPSHGPVRGSGKKPFSERRAMQSLKLERSPGHSDVV
ncbi:pentatricopeptide repeat-containing protein [Pyrus ussuriensis x Pyrus communis]|uniref:Pentatricopeptide repeat-containing protein n=1 Tax=Pyrus ussuriensis x Pyrus communis TaxID=2448454 RepID=A0A5N5HCH2_9ROSA|nr:pentatricopeptide repeat-containing protein [Pyrus ussuriensis x Pyrus communis]